MSRRCQNCIPPNETALRGQHITLPAPRQSVTGGALETTPQLPDHPTTHPIHCPPAPPPICKGSPSSKPPPNYPTTRLPAENYPPVRSRRFIAPFPTGSPSSKPPPNYPTTHLIRCSPPRPRLGGILGRYYQRTTYHFDNNLVERNQNSEFCGIIGACLSPAHSRRRASLRRSGQNRGNLPGGAQRALGAGDL